MDVIVIVTITHYHAIQCLKYILSTRKSAQYRRRTLFSWQHINIYDICTTEPERAPVAAVQAVASAADNQDAPAARAVTAAAAAVAAVADNAEVAAVAEHSEGKEVAGSGKSKPADQETSTDKEQETIFTIDNKREDSDTELVRTLRLCGS